MAGAARVLAVRVARLALCTLGVVACGSNTPTIPPELLASPGGCESPDYPDGPFGSEEGDTLANACFKGFRNPAKVSHDEASLETIAFSDYYDPTGSKGFQLVLIDTSATRLIERMDEPSQSMARIWTRLERGSLFMPKFILNFLHYNKQKVQFWCCSSHPRNVWRLTSNLGSITTGM